MDETDEITITIETANDPSDGSPRDKTKFKINGRFSEMMDEYPADQTRNCFAEYIGDAFEFLFAEPVKVSFSDKPGGWYEDGNWMKDI